MSTAHRLTLSDGAILAEMSDPDGSRLGIFMAVNARLIEDNPKARVHSVPNLLSEGTPCPANQGECRPTGNTQKTLKAATYRFLGRWATPRER